MIRLAIATLGCKTNSYESAAIAAAFRDEVQMVDFDQEADIYIVNTCTVTGRTDFKSRNLIRKALAQKEARAGVRVVVTGCFAQRHPQDVALLGAVDLIVDNQHKALIAQYLDGSRHKFEDASMAQGFHYSPVSHMLERSRAFQKIQDGCGLFCAYCAVSHARGPSRSASASQVLQQARLFVENGYREIVLGGVNLGLYQDGEIRLADLIRQLRQIDGLKLLRLSSLEPQLMDEKLIQELAAGGILCPHLHLSLQSGSDNVLKRMGRRYSSADFIRLVHRIKELVPDCAIGADVITGFPEETDAEFAQSLQLVSDLPLCYLHVFAYSKRPGTPAAKMAGQIPNAIKKQRSELMQQVSRQHSQAYQNMLLQSQIPLRGVVESISEGTATLLSDHYVRAYTKDAASPGSVIRLRPDQEYKDGLLGTNLEIYSE